MRQCTRLQWSKPTEWKERNVRNAVTREIRDESIVGSLCQVVLILDADDGDDPPRFRDLRGRDVAQPDMTYQALLLKLGQDSERRLDGAFCRLMDAKHAAQVDYVKHIEAEISEVVVNRPRQLSA